MNNFKIHIDDKILNVFIINPDILDLVEVKRIKLHLKECSECKQYYEELLEFHNFLKELPEYENEIISKPNKERYEKNNILLMTPYGPFESVAENNIRLAAMDKANKNSPFSYVNTYASAQKYVMVRVLKNNETGEYILFLLCDDMEKVKNALFCFDGFGKYCIADEKGKIVLQQDYFVDNLDFIVFLPVARFKLASTSEDTEYEIDDNNVKLNYRYKGSELYGKFMLPKGKQYEKTKIAVINSKEMKSSEIIDSDNFEFSLQKNNIMDFNEVILYEGN